MASTTKSKRRNNDNDDYSSLASSATIASTAMSSTAENQSSEISELKDNEFPVMDIDEAIDRLGMGLFQIHIVMACGLCFASDAMEYLLLSYLGVILQSQWNLSESESDLISAVVFLGALVGTLTLTPLGDKWGRRIVFGLTSSIISIFGIGSAFCTSYSQILAVRFLVGFGIGGLTVPYDTLGEFMPNSRRGKNMLSTSFFWISASLMVPLFAWLTVGTQDNSGEIASWRAFILLCSLPSVVSTALGIWIVPESPRWLLTRGKHEHALRILRRAAAKNGKDPFLVFPQGVQIVDPTIPRRNHETNSDGIQRDTITNNNNTTSQHSDRICSMCASSEWRKISLLMGIQWYGLTFMYYGAIMAVSIVFSNIQKGDDNNGSDNDESDAIDFDYWALLIASSAEIVGLLLAILLVDRTGRVSTQSWAYSLGGLSLLLLGILDFYEDSDESPRNYLIVFAFLSRMFIMGATAITWLHTAELLPTRFRATGHGLGKFLSSIVLFVSLGKATHLVYHYFSRIFYYSSYCLLAANALGRIGGMTCPFIVSRDNSLRTIGIVMFSVGLVTALSVYQLPETVGKALGNFSLSLNDNEQTTLNPETPHSPQAKDEKFHDQQQDPTNGDEEEADERLVSSFEIL